jgi:hypothetical protein
VALDEAQVVLLLRLPLTHWQLASALLLLL